MSGIFYEVFNKNKAINDKILKELKKELKTLLETFKEKNDIDYIKVLRNKLAHLLENSQK
jgi:hypothetical protein